MPSMPSIPSFNLGGAAIPDTAASMAPELHPNTVHFHAICDRIIAIAPEGEGSMLVSQLFQCIQYSAQFEQEKVVALQAEHDALKEKYELLKLKYFEKKEALARAEERSRAATKTSQEKTATEPKKFNGTDKSVLLNYVRFRRDLASFLMDHPHLFASDRAKASFVIARLEGEAIQLFYRDARLAGRDAATLSLRDVLDLLENRYGAEHSEDPHRELVLDVFGRGSNEPPQPQPQP